MITGGHAKVSEAVKDILVAASPGWSESPSSFTREITLFVQVDLIGANLTCVVCPVSKTMSEGTRKQKTRLYQVGIWLIEKAAQGTGDGAKARQDQLVALMDEIEGTIDASPDVTVDGRQHAMHLLLNEPQPPSDLVALKEHKLFLPRTDVVVYDN